jgi:hypothetical protein
MITYAVLKQWRRWDPILSVFVHEDPRHLSDGSVEPFYDNYKIL